MPKRCALGCYNKNTYHQFPHPEKNPDRFKAWVHIAGGKLDSPADYELYRKKVICDIHFTDRDRNRNNRLNFLAVPSLHLPGKSDEAGTSKKVFLAPEPVIEESILAALKPTLADGNFQNQNKKRCLSPELFNEIMPQFSQDIRPVSPSILRREITQANVKQQVTRGNKEKLKELEVKDYDIKKTKCNECEFYDSDNRNEVFGQLIAEEFKYIKPCVRTKCYIQILKYLQEAKGNHINEIKTGDSENKD